MPYTYKHRTRITKLRIFLLCLCVLSQNTFSQITSNAENWITATQLRQQIDLYTRDYFARNYSDKILGDDLIVSVGSIDSRLRLKKCQQPLDMKVKSNQHNIANATIQVACTASNKWSIYVPVKVEIYEHILSAATLLIKGKVIAANDVTFTRINTTRLNSEHFTRTKDILGQQVIRTIRTGEIIKPRALSPEKIIKKGDAVTLRAKTTSISVEVNAIAMESGHLGKQIKVKNSQSKRIINAVITAPGIVTANM